MNRIACLAAAALAVVVMFGFANATIDAARANAVATYIGEQSGHA